MGTTWVSFLDFAKCDSSSSPSSLSLSDWAYPPDTPSGVGQDNPARVGAQYVQGVLEVFGVVPRQLASDSCWLERPPRLMKPGNSGVLALHGESAENRSRVVRKVYEEKVVETGLVVGEKGRPLSIALEVAEV